MTISGLICSSAAARSRRLLLVVSLLLASLIALAFTVTPASAQLVRDDPQSGTLMLYGDANALAGTPAIRLATDMSAVVSGNIARVRVTQVFRNTSSDWLEGVYLYPLPEDAAVDSLKMTVGNRVIIGKINKRAEARQIYEAAKQEGRKAGLVEQQRPNMFTNSVANIGPGETVLVAIEYQMPLKQVDGRFSLRLPLVVGPRFVPPQTVTDQASLDDARTITAAPIVNPQIGKINPVSITIDLSPGFEPANIESLYHPIAVAGEGSRRTITLADGTTPQDRDFELSWISASASPTLALYREEVGGKHYVMASVTPPFPDEKGVTPPRELIFVIDNSGSMRGMSMREAKASLLHALKTLRPDDYFNIIRFDDTMETVFGESVQATPANIDTARNFTENLQAQGGTQMLPALEQALIDHGVTARDQVIRQIIFLTDGNISNEIQMLEAIGADKGNSRIFSVGIGSAPNNYLMNRMATAGRGIYTNIGKASEVTPKMAELIDMLSRPAMQNLTATVDGSSFDLTPKLLPDLYAGEPLVLLGQGDSLDGTIRIAGTFEGADWSRTLDFSDATLSPSIAKLWARKRIDDIEADRVLREISFPYANAAIEKLGLDFHIVTSQTSLVAVDETPARPDATPLRREDLPINLPAGWDFDYLFGGDTADAALANEKAEAQRATQPEVGLLGTDEPAEEAAAYAPLSSISAGGSVIVTATNYHVQLFAGLFALLIGLFGLIVLRRRKVGWP